MPDRNRLLLWISALLILASPGRGQVTIAVTANMRPVMEAMKPFLERAGRTGIVLVPGASGQLASQIIAGAPYDIFLSADTAAPGMLARQGRIEGQPVVYVHGTLILWSAVRPVGNDIVQALTAPAVRHIAIANPAVAPYGAAAMDALRHYRLADRVKGKLVYGESVTQVNRYILSGEAEMGFTAQSAVKAAPAEKAGWWISVDTTAYRPIAQGMVLLKRDGRPAAAAACFRLLQSDSARSVYRAYGYTVR